MSKPSPVVPLLNLRACISLIRPGQWHKSLIVVLPLLFSDTIFHLHDWSALGWVTFSFLLAMCSTYAFNDVIDAEGDRLHPARRFRPVAAMQLTSVQAITISFLFLVCSILVAYHACIGSLKYILTYLIIQFFYCIRLKRLSLIDICCISSGFALRVSAGAEALNIGLSTWFLSSIVTLALFLALCKRRAELTSLSLDDNSVVRRVAVRYNLEFLNSASILTATSGYLFYSVWVFVLRPDNSLMLLSTFVALVAILRYLQLLSFHLYKKSSQESDPSISINHWTLGERPERDALSDNGIRACALIVLGLIVLDHIFF